MSDRELNFAREILGQRPYRDVPDDEVLREAERLLGEWLAGDIRMERPKLYDHYALLLLALTRRARMLEDRVTLLESRLAALETPEPGQQGTDGPAAR